MIDFVQDTVLKNITIILYHVVSVVLTVGIVTTKSGNFVLAAVWYGIKMETFLVHGYINKMEIQYDFVKEARNDRIEDLIYEIQCMRGHIQNLTNQINALPPPETLIDGIYSYQIQESLEDSIEEQSYQVSIMVTELEQLTL